MMSGSGYGVATADRQSDLFVIDRVVDTYLDSTDQRDGDQAEI